jgi:phage baseplate assembly protein W
LQLRLGTELFMSQEVKSFLGTGWSFPPTFDKGIHALKMVSDEEDVAQSLFIILSTTPGERVMNPKFGCNLNQITFKILDETTRQEIISLVREAVLNYEPRISLEQVEVIYENPLEGLVHVILRYRIRTINVRTNIVYPFYLIEGTNVTNM